MTARSGYQHGAKEHSKEQRQRGGRAQAVAAA
jgi:hypothetical protein